MLGLEKRVLIVAEIGNNHEGRFAVAKELVERAARAGADAVKFQTFRTEHYVSRANAARFARLKGFELSYDQFAELAALARERGLLFLSTPFDLESEAFLETIVDALKIASGDNDFVALLEAAARSAKPLIVSTGASEDERVTRLVELVTRLRSPKDFALLHCVASYPVPPNQANLRSIPHLAARFPAITIGYSDHTIGIEAAVLSVALGARIIEKHFTLAHDFSDFRDHQLSADPDELATLVTRVRAAETLLGRVEKVIQPCERDIIPQVRRSIIAARDLQQGQRLTLEDLSWVRPSGGLSPGEEVGLLGRTVVRAIPAGEVLKREDMVE